MLISGPSDAAEATIVLGANDACFCGQRVVSNASCTTNALAPLLKLLDGTFGVESAHMTTVHCYTGSQPTIDAPRDDPARSRAAAMSMVPTGHQRRAADRGRASPNWPDGSPSVPFGCRRPACRPSTWSSDCATAAISMPGSATPSAAQPLLGWTDRPLVSTDLRGRPESLVLAGPETMHGPRSHAPLRLVRQRMGLFQPHDRHGAAHGRGVARKDPVCRFDNSKKAAERQAALEYHERPRPGKLEIRATKPTATRPISVLPTRREWQSHAG